MKQSGTTQVSELSQFTTHFDSRFAKVIYSEKDNIILCELKSEYVPIEHFKDTFYKISELVKKGINGKFIFDKRSLRAFHQPSMEWYYVVWKKDMYQHGLAKHRKILPKEAWFRKSVEIARNEMIRAYPNDPVLDKLDIRYCESIEEALEN